MPTHAKQTFCTDISIDQINKILDLIEDCPGSTAKEIYDLLELRSMKTLRTYLNHLEANGDIVGELKGGSGSGKHWSIKSRQVRVKNGGAYQRQTGRPAGSLGTIERADAGMPKVEFRRHWPLHMVRDPLVAYLFGPARVAA